MLLQSMSTTVAAAAVVVVEKNEDETRNFLTRMMMTKSWTMRWDDGSRNDCCWVMTMTVASNYHASRPSSMSLCTPMSYCVASSSFCHCPDHQMDDIDY